MIIGMHVTDVELGLTSPSPTTSVLFVIGIPVVRLTAQCTCTRRGQRYHLIWYGTLLTVVC